MKHKSVVTIDYLKVCFKNLNFLNPFYPSPFDSQEEICQLTARYINNFYDHKSGKYLVSSDVELIEYKDEINSGISKFAFQVFFKGTLIGLLFTDSVSPDYSFFKFENRLFTSKFLSFSFIRKLLETTFHLELNNITNIQIALDTTFDAFSKYSPIIYRSINGYYFDNLDKVNDQDRKKYALDIKALWKNSQGAECYQHKSTLYIGDKKNSGKQTKIYEKTDFSRDYQKKFFSLNFPDAYKIFRIEVELVHKKFDIAKHIEFEMLDNQEYLIDRWLHLTKPTLTFKKLANNKPFNCSKWINIVVPQMVPMATGRPDLIEVILVPENPLIPVEKKKIKPSEEKRFFKASFKKYLEGEVDANTVIGIIENHDLGRIPQDGPNFDLEKNKEIALNVMRSVISKEIQLPDLSRYNQLISAINSKDWHRDNSIEQMLLSEKIQELRKKMLEEDYLDNEENTENGVEWEDFFDPDEY